MTNISHLREDYADLAEISKRERAELTTLRAQVETLTRERDELERHRKQGCIWLTAEREKVRRLVECVRKIANRVYAASEIADWSATVAYTFDTLLTVSDITAPTDEVK